MINYYYRNTYFININSNRLTHVFTSRDNLIWEKEAKYWYYKHGPLARTEVGDLDVQGIDYAYTLQGWVKGINSNILEADKDLGRDNMDDAQNLHKNFGEDAASYSIGYFSGDFVAINPNYANFVAGIGSAGLATEAPDLYNGNINHMVTTIRNDAYAAQPQLTAYRYDQLNRIKQMRVQNSIINNSWTGSWIDRYKTLYDYDANGNIMSLTRYGGISPIEIIDQMHYQYSSNNNQLEYIKDQYPLIETPTTEPNFSGQSSGNYKYDLIGNMTEDVSGKIKEIKWNVYGKIESISRPDGNTTDDCLYFEYDAAGNRVYKKSWRKDASNNDVQIKHTFYVRDAQGNIIATYTKDGSNEIKLGEYNLYGSSRIGTASYNTTMSSLSWQNSGIYSRTLGLKRYEISNHLGNVLTVFSDKKKTLTNNHTTPYIVSTTDYDPFGMIMNGRNWNPGEYRFGFNGQEKDQETYNNQSTTTAMFWEYDGRIGRRWNLDPIPQVYMSDYACFGNNPIVYNDVLGNKKDWYQNKETKKYEYFQGSEKHEGYERVGNDDHFGEMLPTAQVLDLSTEHPVAKNHILYTAYTRNKYRKDIAQGGFRINTQHQIQSQWVKDFNRVGSGTLIAGMLIPLAAGVLAPNLAEVAPTLFSFSKLSWTSLASGGADFLSQMTFNGGKLKNWNITQSLSSAFLKYPLGQSIIGSAFEITPENLEKRDNILGNTFLFGDKNLGKFAAESIIGGFFNHAGGESIQGLGIKNALMRVPSETSLLSISLVQNYALLVQDL